jgi:hypothetical protein
MIGYKQFERIIKNIQKNSEDNKKLTKILECKDACGWVDFGSDLVNDLVFLLEKIFDDKYDEISWWLWDSKKDKYIWWEGYKYDLTKIKDLYYWLKKDYKKVKRGKEEDDRT